MKYRKKPVVIEAMQWDETTTMRSALEAQGMRVSGYEGHRDDPNQCRRLRINTGPDGREGTLYVERGDWIIRGVKGEFYPCKPDIFEATYESVDDP